MVTSGYQPLRYTQIIEVTRVTRVTDKRYLPLTVSIPRQRNQGHQTLSLCRLMTSHASYFAL